MKRLVRLTQSRTARLAVSPAAAFAAVVAAAGLVAGQGSAAPAHNSHTGSHLRKAADVKRPKLRHGVLTVEGTEAGDLIALRLQAGDPDALEVEVRADRSAVFSFDRERVQRIYVDARAGDDLVRIDDGNGAFTDSIPTTLDGGDGNDTVAGGRGAETLLGGAGNDSIDGNGGNDVADLGSGDDTFVWDPGDGSDTVEGQGGLDTMRFNGAGAAERVALSANGNRLRFFRDPGSVTMDTAGVEQVDFNALGGADQVTVDDLSGTDVTGVNLDLAGTLGGGAGDEATDHVVVDGTNGNDAVTLAGDASGITVSGLHTRVAIQHQEPTDELVVDGLGGNDAISAAGLAAGAISLTLGGGAGDDTIAGAQGVETALGGDGNDSIDGNGGNDTAALGSGDDTFVWDPGDGSDTVEGEDGSDTMVFNGANAAEQVELSANGNRLRFFRNPGTITMDTAGVEQVDFAALGGADLVTVDDLGATDVQSVNVDLAGTLGGAAGDDQSDRVVVDGTNGDDAVSVGGDSGAAKGGVQVGGLAATVAITHAEAGSDRLEINTLAGSDTVDSSGLAAGAIQLLVNGALVP